MYEDPRNKAGTPHRKRAGSEEKSARLIATRAARCRFLKENPPRQQSAHVLLPRKRTAYRCSRHCIPILPTSLPIISLTFSPLPHYWECNVPWYRSRVTDTNCLQLARRLQTVSRAMVCPLFLSPVYLGDSTVPTAYSNLIKLYPAHRILYAAEMRKTILGIYNLYCTVHPRIWWR